MENKTLFDIFNESKNVSNVLLKMKLCDNTINRNKIKNLMLEVNFDINIYKERKKKYCKTCNKLLKNQKKFCSSSCSASFNNLGTKKTELTKEKISNTLKNKNVKVDIKDIKLKKSKNIKLKNNFCLNCNNPTNNNNKYCSNKCSAEKMHMNSYNYFLLNPNEFNRGNYTPKSFKKIFLKDQDFKCKICGMDNIWNNNELVFVLDHIDGDSSNNKRENLRLICPNCDSQTSTFKSKNKNSTQRNYWKEKIINDINNKIVS